MTLSELSTMSSPAKLDVANGKAESRIVRAKASLFAGAGKVSDKSV
jgi:hypothetical protein